MVETVVEIKHFAPPSNVKDIETFLRNVDKEFIPELSARVDIAEYSQKLSHSAEIFNMYIDGDIVGNISVYMNQGTQGYISSFAISSEYQRKGLGKKLWKEVESYAKDKNITEIFLEVSRKNKTAFLFYQCLGFEIEETNEECIKMRKQVNVI